MVFESSHNNFNSRHRSIPNSCVWYIYENVFTTARVREILNGGLRAEQHQPLHSTQVSCYAHPTVSSIIQQAHDVLEKPTSEATSF